MNNSDLTDHAAFRAAAITDLPVSSVKREICKNSVMLCKESFHGSIILKGYD